MANPNWTKGKSGNPAGRPRKERALTEILEAAGNKTVKVGDKSVARKRVLAELIWQLMSDGKATLPNGRVLEPDPKDWLAVIQFLYKHIDGPPPASVDVTSGGEKIKGYTVLANPDLWDESKDDGNDSDL